MTQQSEAIFRREVLELYDAGEFSSAMTLTKALVEQGSAFAEFLIGEMYELGRGVPEDSVEAHKWYLLSAEKGDANAQFRLGVQYENGCGVQRDFVQSHKWYLCSAAQGNASAQFNLAVQYEDGIGVERNYGCSMKWYSAAAQQGDARAKLRFSAVRLASVQRWVSSLEARHVA